MLLSRIHVRGRRTGKGLATAAVERAPSPAGRARGEPRARRAAHVTNYRSKSRAQRPCAVAPRCTASGFGRSQPGPRLAPVRRPAGGRVGAARQRRPAGGWRRPGGADSSDCSLHRPRRRADDGSGRAARRARQRRRRDDTRAFCFGFTHTPVRDCPMQRRSTRPTPATCKGAGGCGSLPGGRGRSPPWASCLDCIFRHHPARGEVRDDALPGPTTSA